VHSDGQTMNAIELSAIWRAIARPLRDRMSGQLVFSRLDLREVWAAVDHDGTSHLLVHLPPGAPPIQNSPTRGLLVSTEELQISDRLPGVFIDISCRDPRLMDPFIAFCTDLLSAIERSSQPPSDVVMSRLAYWRRFWSAPADPLNRDAALGLFGELWFLLRWLSLPNAVHGWVGPTGARHDFRWRTASVEVKTTQVRTDGPATHRITNLDQLDDAENGRLFLFSLQVVNDDLAANSLPLLVSSISNALDNYPDDLAYFLDTLACSGYSPAHSGQYGSHWRVVAEEIYIVSDEFPRLTRRSFVLGMPAGVDQIAYSLNLSACSRWRIATTPSQLAPTFFQT
jgi:hypothetical protein